MSAAENWNKGLPLQTCQNPEGKMRETSSFGPPSYIPAPALSLPHRRKLTSKNEGQET
jgi:hypothetical protein